MEVKKKNLIPICSRRICPIFQVSNVTGENLGLLRQFLNLLTTRVYYDENDSAEFQIDDTYTVPGTAIVLSQRKAAQSLPFSKLTRFTAR